MDESAQPNWMTRKVWESSSARGKILLSVAILVCGWLANRERIGLFPPPGNNPSLLMQGALPSLIAIAILFPVLTIIGGIIAGSVRFDAGLYVAAVALSLFSIHSGTMHDILFDGAHPTLFLGLAGELIVLYLIIALARLTLVPLNRLGLLANDAVRDPSQPCDSSLGNRLSAVVVQIVVMTAMELLVARSDDKQQAIAAVFIGGWLGAAMARWSFPVDEAAYYWIGPLVVGCFGYVAAFMDPSGWQTGSLNGWLAGLARPIPLDYATAGLAGSILGYWVGRRWQHMPEAETPNQSAQPTASASAPQP